MGAFEPTRAAIVAPPGNEKIRRFSGFRESPRNLSIKSATCRRRGSGGRVGDAGDGSGLADQSAMLYTTDSGLDRHVRSHDAPGAARSDHARASRHRKVAPIL